jgi:hypothetical protein
MIRCAVQRSHLAESLGLFVERLGDGRLFKESMMAGSRWMMLRSLCLESWVARHRFGGLGFESWGSGGIVTEEEGM